MCKVSGHQIIWWVGLTKSILAKLWRLLLGLWHYFLVSKSQNMRRFFFTFTFNLPLDMFLLDMVSRLGSVSMLEISNLKNVFPRPSNRYDFKGKKGKSETGSVYRIKKFEKNKFGLKWAYDPIITFVFKVFFGHFFLKL